MTTRGRGRPAADDPAPPTNEALLDAALAMFAAQGFEGTSVRELARSLEVSHNFIPQRFGSKEALWYAAVDHGFAVLAEAMAETAVDAPDVDIDRLRAMVVRFVAANASRPALLRVINQEASTPGPRLDHLYDHYIEPVRRFGEEVLAGLRAAGKVRTDSVPLFYFLMTHGAGGPLVHHALAARFGDTVDPDDPVAVDRYAHAVVDVLFDGLLVEGA